MRKFSLINSIGERVDLFQRPYLFTNPSGLGMQQKAVHSRFETGFYKNVFSDTPLSNIAGEINIFSSPGIDAYERYRQLLDWLNKGYALTLAYCPVGVIEYLVDVDIEFITKGEKEKTGLLICPVSFTRKTPFYKYATRSLIISPDAIDNEYRYDWAYDVTYPAESVNGAIDVSSNGQVPSSIKVEAAGPLANPSIELTDTRGELVGRMQLLNTNISYGQTLVYSSLYLDSGVWVDGVDMISALDLANENFFRVPLDGTYVLAIKSDGAEVIRATVYLYDYFRSV